MKYIIYIILFILIIFNVYDLGRNSVKITEIVKTDTITKVDTITIHEPKIDTVYLTKYVTDTLYTTDSIKAEVNIPITTTIYKDSTYEASVSGYKVKLDYFTVYPKETYIYKEKTLEKANKQPFITHGIQVGVGYGMINKKPDAYIGYGIQINF